jgi:hypothetical protein
MRTRIQNPFGRVASFLGNRICLALAAGSLGISSGQAATETFNTPGTFQ